MAEQAWLINPKRKRRTRTTKRRKKPMAVRRRRRVRRRNPNPNPNPRRRRASGQRLIPLPRMLYPQRYNPNPRRRKRVRRRAVSSYRRRRRNPPSMRQVGTTLLPNLGWATAGFMTTKFVGNMVTPMLAGFGLPGNGAQPLIRIGTKLGIAYLASWLLEFGFGKKVFVPAFVGGSLEVGQDIVNTYITPFFPTLGAYQDPLEVYYERSMIPGNNNMGAYNNYNNQNAEMIP